MSTSVSTFGNEIGARSMSVHPEITAFGRCYPELLPGIRPCGHHGIIGKALPEEKRGSLFVAPITQEADKSLCQIGKLLAVGPLWYEAGIWKNIPRDQIPKVGDIVYFAPYDGIRLAREDAEGLFIHIRDLDVISIIDNAETALKLKLYA